MVVCKFFQQGNCKFGAQCRFEHPGSTGPQTGRNGPAPPRGPSGGQNQLNSQNRFDAFQPTNSGRGGGGFGRTGGNAPRDSQQQQQSSNSLQNRISGFGRGRGGFGGGRNQNDRRTTNARLDQIEVRLPADRGNRSGRGRGGRNYNEQPRTLKVERSTIISDLTDELPTWLMSSYIPSPQWPKQLFEGYDTEQSPEEIRLLFELAKAQNNAQDYVQLEQRLAAEAESRRTRALGDMDGVMQYLQDGANEHPNRLDIVQASEPHGQAAGVFILADNHPLNVAKYGAPRNPRGGRNQQNNNINTDNNNAFNSRPPQMGVQNMPLVQQPPATFGNPGVSTFGGGGFGTNAQTISFGGQGAFASNNSNNQQNPAFGVPAAPGGFAAPGFGLQAPGLAVHPQPQFGQPQAPSAFGGAGFPQAATPASFGAHSQQQPNQFGQMQQPPLGGFGQTTPVINMNDAPASPGPNQLHNAVNGFSTQAPNAIPNGTPSQPSNAAGFGTVPTNRHALPSASGDVHTYTTSLPNGNLSTWKGRPVQYNQQGAALYQRADGEWERIWFPAGPPQSGGAILATQSTTQGIEETYGFLREHDSFADGMMPVEPPSAEMIRWDI